MVTDYMKETVGVQVICYTRPTVKTVTRKRIVRALVALLLLYVGICLTAMWFEESLIYLPTRHPVGRWDPGKAYGLEAEDWFIETSDGERIHAWFAPATKTGAPVLLFFHGNAGNLSDRGPFVRMLVEAGCSVCILDYRGYGRSTGRPSEEGLYRDGEAVLTRLVEKEGIPADRVVLFGRSLGGGVATELAHRHPEVAGLILESTFRSVPHIAARQFPFLPVRLLVRTRFDNLKKIPEVESPILILHGTRDRLIPIEEGHALHKAAAKTGTVDFHPIEGAGHNNTAHKGGQSYLKKIRTFAEDVTR